MNQGGGEPRVEYEPARPVWLELARALPPGRLRRSDVPLQVQAGIDIARVLPAQLHAWQQTSTGDWFAEVQATVVNRTERAHHEVWLLAAAVSPRDGASTPAE